MIILSYSQWSEQWEADKSISLPIDIVNSIIRKYSSCGIDNFWQQTKTFLQVDMSKIMKTLIQ